MQLGRRSTSPILEIPFKDRPAIIRTPASMQSFVELDQELNRLDEALDADRTWPTPPVASTSKLAISSSAVKEISTVDPVADATTPTLVSDNSHLASLLQTLNPPPSSSSSSSPLATSSRSTPATETATLPPSLLGKSTETIWWETISSSTAALGSGVPDTGFVGVSGEENSTGTRRKVKGKGKAVRKQVDGSTVEKEQSLGERMSKNVETLRKIRNLHGELSSGVAGSLTEVRYFSLSPLCALADPVDDSRLLRRPIPPLRISTQRLSNPLSLLSAIPGSLDRRSALISPIKPVERVSESFRIKFLVTQDSMVRL